MRLFIGKTIFNRDEALRQLLRDYSEIESVQYSRGTTAVTRLLERNLIPASDEFSFSELTEQQLAVLGDDMSETRRPPPPRESSFLYVPRQTSREAQKFTSPMNNIIGI